MVHGLGLGAKHQEEIANAATGGRLVVPLMADVDVVGLNIEDKLILGPLFLERLGILDLVGGDLIAVAEDLVERQEGGGHAAAAPEEIAPRSALPPRRLFADLGQPVFVFLLLSRLRGRDKLFVGSNPRRDRRQKIGLGIKIALTDPHKSRSWSGWERVPIPRG